jgi:transposase InsO family protein
LSEKTFTGSDALIQGVECGFLNVPLHVVNLKSDFVNGPVTVGVMHSLPVTGVHLLLGNDLAGDKVVVNPLVTANPSLDQIDPIEIEIPELYPGCAVTRAMAKKALSNEVEISLSDTFMGHLPEVTSTSVHDHIDLNSSDPSVSTSSNNSSNQGEEFSQLSKSQLLKEQENDPELNSLFQMAITDSEIDQVPTCYYLKNGILMRKYRPPEISADDEWQVKHQIVVPKSYRQEILSLAHETPLAGHLGVSKTYNKILNHFYWPKMRRDVAKFCQSCHTCQMVGKPNQKIPKACLQPIPAIDEPFSRVIVDCVGPLPKTKLGNQYLLTIMCSSTRFPEAIPLRNIKAKSIVKALIKFFTLVGLPKSIQSDQGSNFMSGIFQQVMYELGIKQLTSSAYHPESQGALERFHQTLKNMIRSYCLDTDKNWDEGIHLLLFAVRESVQESLGFSPFELVFGHTVRGPLKLLKEKLLSDDGPKLNLLDYVSDFRHRLSSACDLARKNLENAQSGMKHRFDKHARQRHFKPGDKVLVLLPVPQNPLQAKFFGPYTIEKKLSDLNYIVHTPGRRKQKQLCHINMLKEYFDRNSSPTAINVVINVPSNENVDDFEDDNKDPNSAKLENSQILKNLDQKLLHLCTTQREQLKELINENKTLFPDVPTRTNKIFHDVDIGDAIPIKQYPYRMNPVKKEYLQKEIEYLLENDFIEPSNSSWSSPCVLVPKPDKTFRMCTDYRKLNAVTKSDSFPMPRIDDCIDKIGHTKYISKFDLLKGFWQIPLTDRAKECSAFVTPNGLYQYKVMPFGMKNSPATFQRLINMIINGLENCDAYIDDVIIYNDTWEEHLTTIRKFFDRLSAAQLTINLNKTEFCKAHVQYLGHIVGQSQVKPIDVKVKAISDFPVPSCRKQLMRFLGMAGYYRRFCHNFSIIAEPLTNLLSTKSKFVWSDKCQQAFNKLKAILGNTPVLLAPDFDKSFKLAVDASDIGIGAVLLQEDDNGIDHPVCYFSKKLNKHQCNYSTIEKECLALILALTHFEVYISSSAVHPIIVFSDHNPLTFIDKVRCKNQRLLRWSLMLQEFNIEIRHIRGKDNIIADALSRA